MHFLARATHFLARALWGKKKGYSRVTECSSSITKAHRRLRLVLADLYGSAAKYRAEVGFVILCNLIVMADRICAGQLIEIGDGKANIMGGREGERRV